MQFIFVVTSARLIPYLFIVSFITNFIHSKIDMRSLFSKVVNKFAAAPGFDLDLGMYVHVLIMLISYRHTLEPIMNSGSQ